MNPTMTLEQATQQVETNLRRALSVLPQQAWVEKIAGDPVPCDDPTDGGPRGRSVAAVQYQVHGLVPEEFGRCFDALHEWWTDNGFRELRDDRPAGWYVWVENNADGFRMAAQANDLGELYLFATSPCVWPHGTPG